MATIKGAAAKLKPIKITLKMNPEWAKQMKIVKNEMLKLSKLEMYLIGE